jgi:cell division protein FtsW
VFLCLVVALITVLVPGVGIARGGARRWIGVGAFNIQPSSSPSSPSSSIWRARFQRKRELMGSFVHGVLPHVIVVGTCIARGQPDLGRRRSSDSC